MHHLYKKNVLMDDETTHKLMFFWEQCVELILLLDNVFCSKVTNSNVCFGWGNFDMYFGKMLNLSKT